MATYLSSTAGAPFDFTNVAMMSAAYGPAAAVSVAGAAGLNLSPLSATSTAYPTGMFSAHPHANLLTTGSHFPSTLLYIPTCVAPSANHFAHHPSTISSSTASHLQSVGSAQLKRGPEEVNFLNNLSGVSCSPMEHGMEIMEPKKVRLETIPEPAPSKVVHIRNLPSDATELEITALGTPFGGMSNMVLAKKKNQALLEFRREEMAVKMVNYYRNVTASLRGRNVIIQFSNYQELKTEQQNAAADNALKTANISAEIMEDRGCVLKVFVERVIYPVTVEILYQIFERYGVVEKIITFTRNGQFHALIQMSNSVEAQNAKLYLDCQNIYTGCNTLHIEFSKNNSLNVKYNNEKSRDYTITSSEASSADITSPGPLISSQALESLQLLQQQQQQQQITTCSTLASTGAPDISTNAYLTSNIYPQVVNSPLPVQTIESTLASQQKYLTMMEYFTGPIGIPFLPHGIDGGTNVNLLPFSALSTGGLPSSAGLPFCMNGLFLPQTVHMTTHYNKVLLVSNLDEEKVTPDALFTLFGVYGDVLRVKVIFAKKDNALVQFVDGQQSQQALQHLNGLKLFDKSLKIVYSKHNLVQMPKEGADAGYTKDYTNSPLHRFKKPNSKNFQNIFSPSAVLHLSNIPSDYSENSLCEIFENSGFKVIAFKFFQKDKKMALIQLPSIEEAVIALIKLHNYQLSENFHLRVSFSKSII